MKPLLIGGFLIFWPTTASSEKTFKLSSKLSGNGGFCVKDNKRRTLQRNDIAMAITKYDQFDFLIDIVPRDIVVSWSSVLLFLSVSVVLSLKISVSLYLSLPFCLTSLSLLVSLCLCLCPSLSLSAILSLSLLLFDFLIVPRDLVVFLSFSKQKNIIIGHF